MKVLLINPHRPKNEVLLEAEILPPLGLAYLAAVLEQSNIEVDILDNYLMNYPKEKVLELAKDYDVIGITCLTSTSLVAIDLAKSFKDKFLICGGPHATLFPEQMIEYFDTVVVGEGEKVIVDIIKNKITGIIKGIKTEVLDELPMPDRRKLPMESYPHKNEFLQADRVFSINTSRGCPFNCFVKNTIIGVVGNDKKIQDIVVGDELLAFDNGKVVKTTVTKIFKNEVNELYKITFEDSNSLLCTPEHPFFVENEWIEAQNLVENQEIITISGKEKMKTIYNLPKGRKYFSLEERKKQSKRMMLNNPMKKQEIRNKVSKSIFLQKDIISKRIKMLWSNKKIVGHSMSEKNKIKASKRMKLVNPMFNKNVAMKVSKTTKQNFLSGKIIPFMCKKEFWEKIKLKKNKSEKYIETLLNLNFPNEWKFVGDGEVRIKYFSPDFININGQKKIIEFNGCYWHKCKKCYPESKENKRDANRKKTFNECGYKVLEIWQHELKNEKELIEKIGNFLHNGFKISKIEKKVNLNPIEVYNFECQPYNNYFVRTRNNTTTPINYRNNYVLSHNCSFCSVGIIWGKSYRSFSPSRVKSELQFLIKEYGANGIYFREDNFTYDRKRVIQICELIKDFNLEWVCESRVEHLDEELVKIMKEAGCKGMWFGTESGSNRVLKMLFKGVNKEKAVETFKLCRKYGIKTGASFMLGLPGETKKEMYETLDFAHKLDSYWTWFNYYLGIPGSDLYNRIIKENLYEKLDDRKLAWVKVDGMTSDEMIKFHRWIKFLYHIKKPIRIWRLFKQLPPRTWIMAILKMFNIYKIKL